jgi:hypothetical protein
MTDALTKTEAAAADVDRHIFEVTVKPTITDATIAEHEAKPSGPGHSPELEILLRYLRRNPMRSKPRYVLVETEPFREWCLALHSRRRGDPPTLTERRFTSLAAAMHAIFLNRLLDLGDSEVTSVVANATALKGSVNHAR